MKLLWQHGESSVARLVSALDEDLAYTSVLTTLRVLESKGYVAHRQHGRAFLYSAAVPEQEASRSELKHVLSRFFGNSRERLLLSLLGDAEMDPEELWETTLDPDRRTLLQVRLDDALKADEMFRTLMGEKVEPRRDFIYKYAIEVKDLDYHGA